MERRKRKNPQKNKSKTRNPITVNLKYNIKLISS